MMISKLQKESLRRGQNNMSDKTKSETRREELRIWEL